MLFETVVLLPEKLKLMPVICAAPVVMLLKVLLVIVLVGPLAAARPIRIAQRENRGHAS